MIVAMKKRRKGRGYKMFGRVKFRSGGQGRHP